MEKIWIYTSNKAFNEAEKQQIAEDLASFTSTWAAHGKKLAANYDIKYNRFIILKADEEVTHASGCSIDSSVRFMKELEAKYHIALFDRSNMAYLANNEVHLCPLSEIGKQYKEGNIQPETIVFNPTVNDGIAFQKEWEMPFVNSPYKSFI